MLKRYAFALLVCLLSSNGVRASHIMGSHIAYKWLGGMEYEVTLVTIRDCFGINFGTTELISANSACGAASIAVVAIDTVEVASCSGMLSQCQGGTYPGAELYFYRDTMTLPAVCADWVFSWTSCCRNAAISNIVDPGAQDLSLTAALDNLNHPGNSTPIFQELPGVAICSSVPFCLPNAGYDVDGDSLVYSQVAPATSVGNSVAFMPGFTITEPYPSSNGHAFDPVTGNHCTTPSTIGQYVMAYKVDEYRNGLVVGSSQREVQIWVINCPIAQMDINGTVNDTNGVAVNSGEVQLFQYGLNSAGSIQVGSATLGVGGTYAFNNQPVGQYLVRCISDTASYPGTADSYHESTYYWTYADVVASQCDTTVIADIQLVTTGNLNGTGYLSGFLGDLGIVRTQLGAPWPGVGIILEGWPNGSLMAFTRTNNDGLWSMSGIPDGSYRVIVDHPGLPMLGHYVVTFGNGTTQYADLDYTGTPEGIWPSSALLTVEDAPGSNGIMVYPNPSNSGTIQLTGLPQVRMVLELVDVNGRIVRREQVVGPTTTLATDGLARGMYSLRSAEWPALNARVVVR